MLVGALRGHVVAASFVGNALSPYTGNVYVFPPEQAYAQYLVALVSITLGVLVWERRPDSRTGILLIAFPLVGVLADPIVFPGSRVAVTVGLAASQLGVVIAAHLILSYPTGRFTSRLERGFVAVGYGLAFVYAVPLLLFFDPRAPHYRWFPECLSCARPLTHVTWHDVSGVRDVLDGVGIALIVLFVALLLRKIVRAVPVARSAAWPLAVVAFVGAGRVAFVSGLRLVAPSSDLSWSSAWWWSGTFVTLAISLALAAGMLWGGAGRGARARPRAARAAEATRGGGRGGTAGARERAAAGGAARAAGGATRLACTHRLSRRRGAPPPRARSARRRPAAASQPRPRAAAHRR